MTRARVRLGPVVAFVAFVALGLASLGACREAGEGALRGATEAASAHGAAAAPTEAAGAGGAGRAEGAARPSGEAPSAALARVRAPDDAELAAWLRVERLRAKAEGRALVVFVSAGWCPPCKRVKAALAAGTDGYAGAPVRLVELDADADAARLAAAGYVVGSVPALARVEPHGGPGARWEAPDGKTEAGIVAAWRDALARVAR